MKKITLITKMLMIFLSCVSIILLFVYGDCTPNWKATYTRKDKDGSEKKLELDNQEPGQGQNPNAGTKEEIKTENISEDSASFMVTVDFWLGGIQPSRVVPTGNCVFDLYFKITGQEYTNCFQIKPGYSQNFIEIQNTQIVNDVYNPTIFINISSAPNIYEINDPVHGRMLKVKNACNVPTRIGSLSIGHSSLDIPLNNLTTDDPLIQGLTLVNLITDSIDILPNQTVEFDIPDDPTGSDIKYAIVNYKDLSFPYYDELIVKYQIMTSQIPVLSFSSIIIFSSLLVIIAIIFIWRKNVS